MTRYINADEIIKYLTVYADEEWTSSELEGLLNNAPTIDTICGISIYDAVLLLTKYLNGELVEVVRCKDCKKAETEDCSHSYWDDDWGMWRVGYNGDDWHCADGEMKSNVSEEEKEYLNKAFPEHDGGEWFDITDIITKGETE